MPTPAGSRPTTPIVETIARPAKPRPALDLPVSPLVVGTGQLSLPAEPVVMKAQAPEPQYPLPLVADLPLYDSVMPNQEELGLKAKRIEETLSAFRVDAKVREINPGAAVTQFALEPGAGVKVRSIKVLENDLALALAASTIAIETPIPGQSRVGIVIPNKNIATVGLRETMESPDFLNSKAKLPIALGRDVNGRYIVADLAKMPHLLIAGSTGSGKSVCINSIISTFLLTRSPEQVKMVMVDPKMVELVGYNGVPHLKSPVVIEMDKVVGTLRKALSEMERRYQLFSQLSVRNIDGYNAKREIDPQMENLPYLVVIIDELADLMMTVPDEVESVIVRLAQMARATGIHLIIATQRPSVDVLTGLIKANFPARIAFMVTSQIDSRVILDGPGADRLLGKGDMLFQDPQAAKPVRVQGTFVHDRDIEKMVSHWRQVVPLPQYEPDWTNVPVYRPGDDDEDEEDPMMAKALKIVEEHGTISTSMLQRKLKIGYNKAARLVEQMEEEGIIGPSEGVRGRTVLGSRAKNPADPLDDGAPPPWDEE
jgi:S-DNA-T family DNA segregation ATPase FtsK/SpoIIIE